MIRIAIVLFSMFSGLCAQAAEPPALDIRPASEATAEDFLWQSRLVIVLADSGDDPRFREQLDLLKERPESLIERDVVILTDTDPTARSAIRRTFRPRGFMMVLVAKDGSILLRKPFPGDARGITRSIDKTPLRQQELATGRQ